MRLTEQETLSLITGYVRILRSEDGYLSFSRFTEAQEAVHVAKNHVVQPRSTSSVILEAAGGIRKLSFEFKFEPGSSRNFFGFSIMENGAFRTSFVVDEKNGSGQYSFVPSGSGTVTLVFPNMTRMWIRNVDIDGDWKPVKRPRKLFISGDSITQGYDAREPHRAYSNRLQEAMHAETLSQAVGGDVFDPENLENFPEFDADVAVINFGTNDWSGQRDVKNTSDRYFKRLSELFPAAKVFVVEPIWRATEGTVKEKTGYTVADVRVIIRENALQYGFTVIPGIDLVPHDPGFFSDASLHPNDAGFDHYADNLIRELKMRSPELFES